MQNGQASQQEMPQTVEGLREALIRSEQFADIFRQQRDNAVALANNLQAELAILQHRMEQGGDKQASVNALRSAAHALE